MDKFWTGDGDACCTGAPSGTGFGPEPDAVTPYSVSTPARHPFGARASGPGRLQRLPRHPVPRGRPQAPAAVHSRPRLGDL